MTYGIGYVNTLNNLPNNILFGGGILFQIRGVFRRGRVQPKSMHSVQLRKSG